MELMKRKSLFTLILLWLQSTDALRILGLFPLQSASHHIMCEELMRGLAERGHQVDVYSHFPLKKPIPNYKDFSLRGTLPAIVNNVSYDNLLEIIRPVDFIRNVLKPGVKRMCELLDHPLIRNLRDRPPSDPPYDLVIVEMSHTNCFYHWGRYLNIPIIGVVTLPTLDCIYSPMGNSINLAAETSVFSKYTHPMTYFQLLREVIWYHINLYTFNYIMSEQNKYVHQFFGPNYPDNVDAIKDFSLILVNRNHELHGIKPLTPAIVPVGSLHVVDRNLTLPKDIQKWLDESTHGCIYFSYGSMIRIETFPKHILEVFYASFKNIAPVRVLLKIARPEILPYELPNNVISRSWLPQIPVLKHKNVKAFVTHGGLMGTQESIYFGVPMITTPLFADQYLNADVYFKKNISLKLDLQTITTEKFTNAMQEVLYNPIYNKAVQQISRDLKDRPLSPINTAVFWIEYISRHGRQALKSPLVDMPNWQIALLDIYGFIAAIITIFLYIIIKLVKILLAFAYSKLYNCSVSKMKKNK